MKKGASLLWKNITSLLSSITKSKSLAVKSKIEAMKARVIIFSLLKNKKKFPLTLKTGSVSHRIHALLLGGSASNDHIVNNEEATNIDNLQLVFQKETSVGDCNDDDHKYPDLRHSLFDQEDGDLDDLGNPNASVIDLVKNSMENDGEDFSLEDEIDHVADLFIRKFHKRMRLQKLESFKRYQDMLERSS